MITSERRRSTVERILGEIDMVVDRGDHIATVVHIRQAADAGHITDRDAERLTSMLLAVRGGRARLA